MSLSHMVAEILRTKDLAVLAKRISTENALIPIFFVLGI